MRHDWSGTTLHVTLLTLSITTGLWFYGVACNALHRNNSDADGAWARSLTLSILVGMVLGFLFLGIIYQPPGPFSEAPAMTKAPALFGSVIVSSIIFALCWRVSRILGRLGLWPTTTLAGGLLLITSVGAIEGQRSGFNLAHVGLGPSGPETWIPNGFEALSLPTQAVLMTEDLSSKPSNWTGLPKEEDREISQVKGALLEGSDLRFAEATRVFLVKGRLRHADLRSAHFFESDLRGAIFLGADLRNAEFVITQMQGVDLDVADPRGVVFQNVNLSNASLRTNLSGVIFSAEVQLSGVDLGNADLSNVSGLKPDMLKGACVGVFNVFGEAVTEFQPKLPASAEFTDIRLSPCQPKTPFSNKFW